MKKARNRGAPPGLATTTLIRCYAPNAEFRKISVENQYCYYLLSHAVQEISWLQRAAYVALNSGKSEIGSDESRSAERAACVMQTCLLVRMLLGKTNELRELLESEIVRQFVWAWFDSSEPEHGKAALQELMDDFTKNQWLRTARHKHFLHYPKFNDARPTLEDPSFGGEIEVYLAPHTTNNLHSAADAFANLAWFKRVNNEKPFDGFKEAIEAMSALSVRIETLLSHVVHGFLVGNVAYEKTKITVPVQTTLEAMRMPFFLDMRSSAPAGRTTIVSGGAIVE
jgi:hypothetical protein